jgi:hypothetical protein
MKFELNLKSSTSQLNEIVCKEQINIETLDKLIKSDLLIINGWNPIAEKYHSNEREQLIEYKKLVKNGYANVKYSKIDGMNNYGRVNPKKALGLFCIRRQVRHTLAKTSMVDVDIINAHPVMLNQICKQNNIECDNLQDYVDNRNDYLNKVMNSYKVSKDDAKNLFISILYYGSFETWAEKHNITAKPPVFIKNLKSEMKTIGTEIVKNNPEIVELIKKRKNKQGKKDYNEIGSVVSYFLQEIECRILETIYLYCVDNKIIEDNKVVLCADGLMIDKNKYTDELPSEFEKLIKDKFELNLQFTKKEMDQDFLDILDGHIQSDKQYDINLLGGYDSSIEITKEDKFNVHLFTEYFNEDIQELESDKYQEYFHLTKSFKYFNHFHCFFYQSESIYKLYKNAITECGNLKNAFNDLFFKNKSGNKIKFMKLYDETQHKIKYSKFNFEPNKKIKDDEYNLFSGFVYDDNNNDYNQEIVNIFLNHIKYICNNDEIAYEYLVNWFSHIIQNPESKTNVAIVLYSVVEGVGKNIISDIYGELLQGYTSLFRDTNSLTDKFNGEMLGKLFCIGDEINARAEEIANELKNIITRTKETIEFKNKDKFEVYDYKNYFFTTNNENVFKVSNSDRRYFFVECPDEKQSPEYYEKLVEFKKSPSSLKQLYNYFKTKDLTKFAKDVVPLTDYKKRLIMSNLEAYHKFVLDKFDLLLGVRYSSDELYEMSINYAKNNKMKSKYTEQLFFKQFKKLFGQFNKIDTKTKTSYYIFQDITKDELKEQMINKLFAI